LIRAILLLGMTKNYMDRQVNRRRLSNMTRGWNEIDYCNVVFAFQAAYGLGLLVAKGTDRSSRNTRGLCARNDLLEQSVNNYGLGHIAEWILGCTWAGRVRRVSSKPQSNRDMVPRNSDRSARPDGAESPNNFA
jgi:hypothetical protein